MRSWGEWRRDDFGQRSGGANQPASQRQRGKRDAEWKRDGVTASGSGANQPASDDVHNKHLVWNEQFFIAPVRFMSYNVGAHQTMLNEGPFRKHGKRLQELLEQFVNVDKQEFVCFSELGGYRKGFHAAGLDLQQLCHISEGKQSRLRRSEACLLDLKASSHA